MLDSKDLEEAKKDITKWFFPHYSCYNCYMLLLYLCVFFSLFPLIFVPFSECWMFVFPIFTFFITIILYIKYNQYKKIEIITNIFYQRIRVYVTNKLNMKIEVINIPLSNGCFRLTRMDYKFRMHIWNDYKDKSELDLRKVNIENKALKFYWTFKNIIFPDGWVEFDKWLELLIGREILSDAKFTSEKENHLKYFDSNNFLSFTFRNYMKYYVILFGTIFMIIFYVIVGSIKDQYDEKGEVIFDAKHYLLVLGWHIILYIIIAILIFFHYFRRRIDIFVKDGNLFIGITTFCQKSYKKKYIFELDSIKECGFLENPKTLSIKLNNGDIIKIWKFSEKEEDLKIISNKLRILI